MRKFTAFLYILTFVSCAGERKDTPVDETPHDTLAQESSEMPLQADLSAKTVYSVIKAFETEDQRVIDSLTSPQYGAVVIQDRRV